MKIVFDVFINLFQGFFIADCLVGYFGVKGNNMSKRKVLISGGVIFFIVLHLISVLAVTTNQQNMASTLFIIVPIVFSVLFLKGRIREKVIFYMVLHIIIMFSAFVSIHLLGIYYETDFQGIAYSDEIRYYVASVLAQCIMVVVSKFAIYYYKSFKAKRDYIYIFVAIMIPVISIIMCCLVVYIIDASRADVMAITLILILLIALLNVINLYLVFRESKIYDERLHNQIRVSAYEQQQKDFIEIKELNIETEKIRHEMKRVTELICYMLEHNEIKKVKEFVEDISRKVKIQNESVIYTNNVILNYLLNEKIHICDGKGIRTKCLVTGSIEGIEDVDLYILMGNLLDNAIEAVEKAEKKELMVMLYADEASVNIEIGNSTQRGAYANNPELKTTKNDNQQHGYGIINIKEIVDKYEGYIEYINLNEDYILCKIALKNYRSC